MKIGIIGNGAIASYVRTHLEQAGHSIGAILVRPERLESTQHALGPGACVVASIADMPRGLDVIADCAGHQALHQYGADALQAGYDVVTVSIGALVDEAFAQTLDNAAKRSGATLHLASGAIGALDALRAAKAGTLEQVSYVGRKPPRGWIGSPAEDVLDLSQPLSTAQTHFKGSARDAAIRYPKNANVAAAVALAGVGFDKTSVELIADPYVTANIHEVHARGDFGSLRFQIEGQSLPDNPRSSALAAMSVVATIDHLAQAIRF